MIYGEGLRIVSCPVSDHVQVNFQRFSAVRSYGEDGRRGEEKNAGGLGGSSPPVKQKKYGPGIRILGPGAFFLLKEYEI